MPAVDPGARARRSPVPAETPSPPDLGAAEPAVAAVLANRAAGQASLAEVVTELGPTRLLVPLLAVPADLLAESDEPCAGTTAAVAVASGHDQAGQPQALAFTCLQALLRWRPDARPLPTPARRVAQSAIASGARSLLLDPHSPASVTIRGSWLVRLASGQPCPAPWADPYVAQAVWAEVCAELGVDDPTQAGVRVRLASGSDPGQLDHLVIHVGATGPAAHRLRRGLPARLEGSHLMTAVFEGSLAIAFN